MNDRIVYTIGHSTRSMAEFVVLLQKAGVNLLVDVRRFPHSPRQPHFNIENLPGNLAREGIRYLHLEALGGRRSAKEARPDGHESENTLWRHPSFRNYADYAETPAFQKAFDRLLLCAKNATPPIMCAEANWTQCHRRIIADHLLAAGVDVQHIMSAGRIEPAHLTEGAQLKVDGLIYKENIKDLPLFGNLSA